MKITLAAIAIAIATTTSGYSKPGGWILDILDRSTISVGLGAPVYCAPAPVYYYPQPVYYQSVPAVSRGADVYVYPPAYNMQPVHSSSTRIIYHGQRR